MSAAEQCSDGGGVSVSGQEAEGDGEPPNEFLPSSAPDANAQESGYDLRGFEEAVPPAAKQPRLDNDGMNLNVDANQMPACLQEPLQNQNLASSLGSGKGDG